MGTCEGVYTCVVPGYHNRMHLILQHVYLNHIHTLLAVLAHLSVSSTGEVKPVWTDKHVMKGKDPIPTASSVN